jgi:hypothetical protein
VVSIEGVEVSSGIVRLKRRVYERIVGRLRRLSGEFGTRIRETEQGVFVTF